MELWFDELISVLRKDQITLETGCATDETKKLYDLLMSGGADEIHGLAREQSSMHFVQRIVVEFINELNNRNTKINKLGMNMSKAVILVWVEINDDDKEAEKNIFLAEAKINTQFQTFGYHISTTILEKCDNMEIPSQYKPILST